MNRRNFLTVDRGTSLPARDNGPMALPGDGSQTQPAFAVRSSTGLGRYTGPWGYTQAAHLLRRSMVGPTDAEIRAAVAEGMDATVARLLTPFTPTTTEIAAWAGKDPQFRPTGAIGTPEYQTFQDNLILYREQNTKWWLRVINTSPVSIQERMTLFWHNHFTSEIDVVNLSEWMNNQNQLLRRNALGNFKQFTKDVTVDVAMLLYLDGAKNFVGGRKASINENYARELMELFTCGVSDWDGNPNYTQTDVSEAARALSGYNFTPSSIDSFHAGQTSYFDPRRWDSGSKTVLGKTGPWKANDVVDIIFSERADQTSKYVCGKLYRAFVYDMIDPNVVTEMAATFRNGNWEIKPVIEQLLKSEHFYDVTNIGALDKGPIDFMVGLIRGLGLKNVPDFSGTSGRNSRELVTRLETLGQLVFSPPNVKGWPGGRTWISTSTLPTRQKFTLDVADGKIMGRNQGTLYSFDPIAFAKSFPPGPGDNVLRELSDAMALYLLNTAPSAKESELLYTTILDGGVYYEWSLDNPEQKAGERIRKFMKALFQLAKFQLY